MDRKKKIEIACPHQRRIVEGLYPCDAEGLYIMLPDGAFNLNLIECGQLDGRCAETLCALHRFNRRGPGTWYPDQIRAMRQRNRPRKRRKKPGGKGDEGNLFDQFC